MLLSINLKEVDKMRIVDTLAGIDQYNNINDLKEYWNTNIVQNVYFIPKKVEKHIITERLNNHSYVEKLNNTIKFLNSNNIKKLIEEIFNYFEVDTGYKLKNEKLFLIIGVDTTTIYSTKVDNEDVTVLCLEAINGDIDILKILLAHEYTHFIRKDILQKDIFEECIGERLVTEGIASSYSSEIVPNRKDCDYCIVPDSTIEWMNNNITIIEEKIKNDLLNENFMSLLFYMYAETDIENMPVRCGYVYGYLKVKKYLYKNNLKSKDILGENWNSII